MALLVKWSLRAILSRENGILFSARALSGNERSVAGRLACEADTAGEKVVDYLLRTTGGVAVCSLGGIATALRFLGSVRPVVGKNRGVLSDFPWGIESVLGPSRLTGTTVAKTSAVVKGRACRKFLQKASLSA